MREVSNEFYNLETATKRSIVEIYQFWIDYPDGDRTTWRYTSSDREITYDGNVYEPAPIKRGSVSYDESFEAAKISVSGHLQLEPLTQFFTVPPMDLVWVCISSIFIDDLSTEARVIFLGQVLNLSVKGVQITANCVSFEYFLKQPLPRFRYTPQCGLNLFSQWCGINKEDYKVTSLVTPGDGSSYPYLYYSIDSEEAQLDDDYFRMGIMAVGNERRHIVAHQGNVLTLRIGFVGITAADQITAFLYPGCDKKIITCRDKFDNVVNYRGFPYMPNDNPVLWL